MLPSSLLIRFILNLFIARVHLKIKQPFNLACLPFVLTLAPRALPKHRPGCNSPASAELKGRESSGPRELGPASLSELRPRLWGLQTRASLDVSSAVRSAALLAFNLEVNCPSQSAYCTLTHHSPRSFLPFEKGLAM